jgi:hypothetical protein
MIPRLRGRHPSPAQPRRRTTKPRQWSPSKTPVRSTGTRLPPRSTIHPQEMTATRPRVYYPPWRRGGIGSRHGGVPRRRNDFGQPLPTQWCVKQLSVGCYTHNGVQGLNHMVTHRDACSPVPRPRWGAGGGNLKRRRRIPARLEHQPARACHGHTPNGRLKLPRIRSRHDQQPGHGPMASDPFSLSLSPISLVFPPGAFFFCQSSGMVRIGWTRGSNPEVGPSTYRRGAAQAGCWENSGVPPLGYDVIYTAQEEDDSDCAGPTSQWLRARGDGAKATTSD